MGDRRREGLAGPTAASAPADRRAATRRKIIGRLLLGGGTVEEPLPRASLALALPPLGAWRRARGKGGR